MKHRKVREAVSEHLGLGHTLCSTSLQIDTLVKRNKIHDSEKERERKERGKGESVYEREGGRKKHIHNTEYSHTLTLACTLNKKESTCALNKTHVYITVEHIHTNTVRSHTYTKMRYTYYIHIRTRSRT